tara:strand:- start:481 stop:720 length:240 start_codon:yes stop_codon:yes gene_type:complete
MVEIIDQLLHFQNTIFLILTLKVRGKVLIVVLLLRLIETIMWLLVLNAMLVVLVISKQNLFELIPVSRFTTSKAIEKAT